MNENEAEVLLFAVVRSAVLPIGLALHKTEAEITAKTWETIEAMRKTIGALADAKEKRLVVPRSLGAMWRNCKNNIARSHPENRVGSLFYLTFNLNA